MENLNRTVSATPQTDDEIDDLSDEEFSDHDKYLRMSAHARDMERERDKWKEHAWRETDLRETIQQGIKDLVTTDHESKEAFIQRVRGILSQNINLPQP